MLRMAAIAQQSLLARPPLSRYHLVSSPPQPEEAHSERFSSLPWSQLLGGRPASVHNPLRAPPPSTLPVSSTQRETGSRGRGDHIQSSCPDVPQGQTRGWDVWTSTMGYWPRWLLLICPSYHHSPTLSRAPSRSPAPCLSPRVCDRLSGSVRLTA